MINDYCREREHFSGIFKYRKMKLFCLRKQTGSYLLVGLPSLNTPPFLDYWDLITKFWPGSTMCNTFFDDNLNL